MTDALALHQEQLDAEQIARRIRRVLLAKPD